MESSGASALITGASSGIGAAFAERLARDYGRLVLVARRLDRLKALAKRLADSHGVTIEVVQTDLTDPNQLKNLERRIEADGQLALLVNNAGFGGYMPFVQLEPDRADELIQLQVLAVTRLTRAALPGMIERRQGAVINVASRLAFSSAMPSPPLPQRATYAASKAFVVAFTRVLHGELAGTGVRVQALCPGLVRTEFHERMGLDPARLPAGMIMSPEDVVEASLGALALGEVLCLPALDDPTLIAGVDSAHRDLLEHSGSGKVADRYRS